MTTRPALFTPGKLTDDDIPQGLHCYQLNEQTAEGSASGTVISAVTLDLNNNGYIEVGCELRIRKRGKTWEYSFEKASIGGKRQYVYKGGFKTKSAAATAGAAAMNEYNLML